MKPQGMRSFREKRQVRNFMYSPLVLILLGIVVLFFARSVWQAYAKERASRIGENNARAELIELSTRKDKLEKKVVELKTPQGIEAELRSKYGVARPGEEMIVIIEDDGKEKDQ